MLIPDFAMRGAAQCLQSTHIARVAAVDKSCSKALAMPGFIAEVVRSRRFRDVRTLAQLHLAESMGSTNNILEFGFMSAFLQPLGVKRLRQVARLLRIHPDCEASVEAHSQPGAPPVVALELSRARAAAAMRELVNSDVARSRLRGMAFSNERPLRDCAACDGANRRVEVFLTLDGVQFPAERLPVDSPVSIRATPPDNASVLLQGFSAELLNRGGDGPRGHTGIDAQTLDAQEDASHDEESSHELSSTTSSSEFSVNDILVGEAAALE